MTSVGEHLWSPGPTRIESANMTAFRDFCEKRTGQKLEDYASLHDWSVTDIEGFWSAVWDWFDVVGDKGETLLEDGDKMPGARFFPQALLSYSENLLQNSGESTALVFRGEDKDKLRWSWDDLRGYVSRLQQAFLDAGVKSGDCIAGMVPNRPETIACFLAANSIGAIWSSCSPDFGEQGALDRFSQIEPTLFISCDGYWYNGKRIDIAEKVGLVASRLKPATTIVMSYLGDAEGVAAKIENGISLDAFIEPFPVAEPRFERLPFNHPLYILFSSGTTGIPKCIVHGQGGALLQHLKEHVLHSNAQPGGRIFYFTTCGWMMWNWLVSGLAAKASLVLYDGSPFYPDGSAIFDYADAEKVTYFGTSAKYIDAVRNSGLRPIDTHDLSSVHTMASTGSPLAPENFRFVYDGIKKDIHLASISGGTDICGCFVLSVPWLPVHVGEIQAAGLGMKTEVWDDNGQPISSGKGELVCTRPFPTMPVSFWNDPDGAKYRSSYFERFDNVWCHGDFAEWTENGGMIIHGRSDATLNPGGVRIGTAEIYNQVEKLSEIEEALCIGQQWERDTRVVLFVRLAKGQTLDDELQQKIRLQIRTGASPRHVPSVIVAVDDIPRTKSGKITELAVRDIVHGKEVKNQEALANPEALELFRDRPELR